MQKSYTIIYFSFQNKIINATLSKNSKISKIIMIIKVFERNKSNKKETEN